MSSDQKVATAAPSEMMDKLGPILERSRRTADERIIAKKEKIRELQLKVETPKTPAEIRQQCVYLYQDPKLRSLREEVDRLIGDTWAVLNLEGVTDPVALDHLRELVLSGQSILIRYFDEPKIIQGTKKGQKLLKRSFYHHFLYRKTTRDDFGSPYLSDFMEDLCYLDALYRRMDVLWDSDEGVREFHVLEPHADELLESLEMKMKRPLLNEVEKRRQLVQKYAQIIKEGWVRLVQLTAVVTSPPVVTAAPSQV